MGQRQLQQPCTVSRAEAWMLPGFTLQVIFKAKSKSSVSGAAAQRAGRLCACPSPPLFRNFYFKAYEDINFISHILSLSSCIPNNER